MGRYLCLEPVLPVAMRFHASRSAVTSALASPIGATKYLGIISEVRNSYPNVIGLIWEGLGRGPFRVETDKIVLLRVNRLTIAAISVITTVYSVKKRRRLETDLLHFFCFLDVVKAHTFFD